MIFQIQKPYDSDILYEFVFILESSKLNFSRFKFWTMIFGQKMLKMGIVGKKEGRNPLNFEGAICHRTFSGQDAIVVSASTEFPTRP